MNLRGYGEIVGAVVASAAIAVLVGLAASGYIWGGCQ